MTSNPFESHQPMIAASILSARFEKLGEEIEEVLEGGADFLHLDIMDGNYVPNISFGPAVTAACKRATPAYLDAHLMTTKPFDYAPIMVKAGAHLITFHVEVVDNPAAAAQKIRDLGCRVGVTLDPETPVERLLPALEHCDIALVMSVKPGFSGQKFKPEVLNKCEAIKKRMGSHQRLEIDGGINAHTIRSARDAGCDWFVVASAIFDHPDRPAAIRQIREKLGA